MNIITKSVSEMTPTEYKACYGANYGAGGYMRHELVRCRHKKQQGFVILLWDGPDDTPKSLIAWALMTPVKLYGEAAATRWIMQKARYTAQFWVKRPYRRQGYGTLLMQEIKKYDDRPHVFPHNEKSAALFSAYDVSTDKNGRSWLYSKPKKDLPVAA